MSVSDHIAQRTDCWGRLPQRTRLPWRLVVHADIIVMQEWQNVYAHDPSGWYMGVHWRSETHPDGPLLKQWFWFHLADGVLMFDSEDKLVDYLLSRHGAEHLGVDMEIVTPVTSRRSAHPNNPVVVHPKVMRRMDTPYADTVLAGKLPPGMVATRFRDPETDISVQAYAIGADTCLHLEYFAWKGDPDRVPEPHEVYGKTHRTIGDAVAAAGPIVGAVAATG